MARDKNKPPYLKRIFAGKNVYIFSEKLKIVEFNDIDIFNTQTNEEWKNPVGEIDNSFNNVTVSLDSSSKTQKVA